MIGAEGADTLGTIEQASLTGGASNNTFTVTGWSQTATLDGANGTDTVAATANANLTLTDAQLLVSTGGTFGLDLHRTGQPHRSAGNNTLDAGAFDLGPVSLSGVAGNDTLIGGAERHPARRGRQ